MYDIHLRIEAIHDVLTILGFSQLKMYKIQIIPVQTYAHSCLLTAGNATADSQNLEPPISECDVPSFVCTRATAMYDVHLRIDAIHVA